MPRPPKSIQDPTFLAAALEGLELQKQRIEEQIRQVRAMLGKRGPAPAAAAPVAVAAAESKPARKRNLSEAARRRIAAAQKKRWAAFRKEQQPSE
jgi:DNA-binding IclR family transcriptional regulator